ncbi:hypothetical protein MTO96_051599 [Rhipicephalus appendiculatus]
MECRYSVGDWGVLEMAAAAFSDVVAAFFSLVAGLAALPFAAWRVLGAVVLPGPLVFGREVGVWRYGSWRCRDVKALSFRGPGLVVVPADAGGWLTVWHALVRSMRSPCVSFEHRASEEVVAILVMVV